MRNSTYGYLAFSSVPKQIKSFCALCFMTDSDVNSNVLKQVLSSFLHLVASAGSAKHKDVKITRYVAIHHRPRALFSF